MIKGYIIYHDIVLEVSGEKDYFGSEGGLKEFIKNGIDNAELPDALILVSYYYSGKLVKSYRSVVQCPSFCKGSNHKMLHYGK